MGFGFLPASAERGRGNSARLCSESVRSSGVETLPGRYGPEDLPTWGGLPVQTTRSVGQWVVASNGGLAPVWVISGPSNYSVSEGLVTLARPAQSAQR